MNIEEVVGLIVEEGKMAYDEAMDAFIRSETFTKLTSPETGLYFESAAFVYYLFKLEQSNGKIIQVEQ